MNQAGLVNTAMMHALRTAWTFPYKANEVARGAREQRDFRLSRVAAWQKTKDAVMAKIRESGLSIDESAMETGATLGYASTQVMAPQLTIDAKLKAQLTEAHGKIGGHRALANQYDGWVQVLEAQGDCELHLTHDDWLFFFGKKD